jgi:hypothetical protein
LGRGTEIRTAPQPLGEAGARPADHREICFKAATVYGSWALIQSLSAGLDSKLAISA